MTIQKVSTPAIVILLFLVVAACSSPDEKKERFFAKGKALFEQGNYVKARLEFKNAIQIDPQFADGYYMLGMTELKEKNLRQAFGAFSKSVQLNPDQLEAQLQIGRLLLSALKFEETMKKANLILDKEPDNPDAILLKASVNIVTGELKAAIGR